MLEKDRNLLTRIKRIRDISPIWSGSNFSNSKSRLKLPIIENVDNESQEYSVAKESLFANPMNNPVTAMHSQL